MDPWGLVISWKTLCSTFYFVFKNVENVIATIQIAFFLFNCSLTNAAPVSVKCLEYMSRSHWLNDRLHSCDNESQYNSQYHTSTMQSYSNWLWLHWYKYRAGDAPVKHSTEWITRRSSTTFRIASVLSRTVLCPIHSKFLQTFFFLIALWQNLCGLVGVGGVWQT